MSCFVPGQKIFSKRDKENQKTQKKLELALNNSFIILDKQEISSTAHFHKDLLWTIQLRKNSSGSYQSSTAFNFLRSMDIFNWRHHLFYRSCFGAVTHCLRALSLFLCCHFFFCLALSVPRAERVQDLTVVCSEAQHSSFSLSS